MKRLLLNLEFPKVPGPGPGPLSLSLKKRGWNEMKEKKKKRERCEKRSHMINQALCMWRGVGCQYVGIGEVLGLFPDEGYIHL